MFTFEIPGIPVPQKQTRFLRSTGIAYDPSKKDLELIQRQIKPFASRKPYVGAIEMILRFYMPIPKSTSAKIRAQMLNAVILPTKRPDFDNLAYLVTNALKKIVYADDSQVTDCIILKRYADRPRTEIEIHPLDPIDLTIETGVS